MTPLHQVLHLGRTQRIQPAVEGNESRIGDCGRVALVSECNPHHNQGAPEPVLSEVEVSLAFGDRGGNETDFDCFLDGGGHESR